MANFECCKTRSFPQSYYICIQCFKVYHRSCVQCNKRNFKFIESFKIICCEIQDDLHDIEKNTLEQTISELEESNEMKDVHIEKIKKENEIFLREVAEREEQLNRTILEQEKLIASAQNEIAALRKILEGMTNNPTSTKSIQTEILSKNVVLVEDTKKSAASVSTQTTAEQKVENQLVREKNKSNTIADRSPHYHRDRNEILIVAGHHGRDLAKSMILKDNQNSMIHSILKPNCNTSTLLDTAVKHTKYFTKNDVVIIWLDIAMNKIEEKKIIMNLMHTNTIIITQPYRHDIKGINELIYQGNLQMKRDLHQMKTYGFYIFECNNYLRKSNYLRNGYTISTKGKRFLSEAIWNFIMSSKKTAQTEKVCDTHNTNPVTLENTPNCSRTINCKSLACEIQEINDSLMRSDNEDHFLYPRLSQVAPKITP